ncbi:MAG TPA: class I SAM-dependent methyltransferase [Candidatus Nanoarchaeia archaeon]|nr:class I SAM-dependent methyltransferase [Candidatus Nanoarchaeia archaeon]
MENPLIMHGDFNKDILLKPLGRYVSLEQSSLLEIGSGNGRIARVLSPHVNRYVGIDISDELVQMARREFFGRTNVDFIVADGNSTLPIREESVDVMLYVMALHFLHDHQAAFSEARRVLRLAGVLALFEPSEKEVGEAWSGMLNPFSGSFNPTSYQRKMEDVRRMNSFLESQSLFDVLERNTEYRGNKVLMVLRKKS